MKLLLTQLPLPATVHEPEDASQPLAAALLLSHAARHGVLAGVEASILPAELASTAGDRALVEAIARQRPDIVGFSVSVWNVDRTLWLARRLKEELPRLQVVLGGPEVTRDNERLLTAAGWDVLAFGEGEQSFSSLLRWHAAGRSPDGLPLPGLMLRSADGRLLAGPPAPQLAALDELQPYLDGWLPVPVGSEALLETTRGCRHRCRYCYYPKMHPGQSFVSLPMLRQQVRFLRDRGAAGLYLLDPAIDDRPDLPALLALLAEEGQGRLSLFGELRGESVTPELARGLARAGFREVEVGLQSINPRALAAAGRRGDPEALVAGVAALAREGIRATIDVIVGLPGDTPETVRRTLQFVRERVPGEHVQVFTLSLLPGTALRRDATRLGLRWQLDPPYQVEETPDLGPLDLLAALDLAEELLETELDAAPLPLLSRVPEHCSLLDDPVPDRPLASHTLWCRVADPLAEADRIGARAAAHLAAEPFCTLGVVIETEQVFPYDVYDRIYAWLAPWTRRYLDRLHGRRKARRSWSCRLVVLLPWSLRPRVPQAWLLDGLELADPVWRLPRRTAEGLLHAVRRAALEPWETMLVEVDPPPPAAARQAWLQELSWCLADEEQLVFADPTLQEAWVGFAAAGRGTG